MPPASGAAVMSDRTTNGDGHDHPADRGPPPRPRRRARPVRGRRRGAGAALCPRQVERPSCQIGPQTETVMTTLLIEDLRRDRDDALALFAADAAALAQPYAPGKWSGRHVRSDHKRRRS